MLTPTPDPLDLLPDWWWFRDGHKIDGTNLQVSGTLIAKAPITKEAISCQANTRPVDFLLSDASQAARERFWYLPNNQVRGIQIQYQVTPTSQESLVELRASFDSFKLAQPFIQIHDWSSRHPAPPVANIERVSGFGATAYNYFCNGASDFARFTAAARRHGIDALSRGIRVLDWGAGCGRLTRWFVEHGEATVTGIDIDAENITWCCDNLPEASFFTNALYPPTQFKDGQFDVVLANSVVTHLTEPTMTLWLAEVRRLLATNGVALISFHGNFSNAFFVSRYPNAMHKILSTGFYDEQVGKEMEGVLSDPTYYRQTYMSDDYACSLFQAAGFDVQEFLVGHVSRCQNLAVLKLSGRGKADAILSRPSREDRSLVADATKANAPILSAHQASRNNLNLDMLRTIHLFGLLALHKTGTSTSHVQLRENGILICSQENHSDAVSFNIVSETGLIKLAFEVADLNLNKAANEIQHVGFRILLDDHELLQHQLSSVSSLVLAFDATDAHLLQFRLDTSAAIKNFRGFYIGVLSAS